MLKKIIYIDDEKINLDLFRINFRRHYQVITCSSPQESLEIIANENIRVVLTDYKMPSMNGVQLIEKIKEINPESVCMIISGYLETDVVIDKSNIYRYIMKPYKKQDVLNYINEAFSLAGEST